MLLKGNRIEPLTHRVALVINIAQRLGAVRIFLKDNNERVCQLEEWIFWKWCIGMMKSLDLTVGDALYLYTICLILPNSNDFLLYKESLFLWLCIEPPRPVWHRPAIQQC
jgi:hypothetical protein